MIITTCVMMHSWTRSTNYHDQISLSWLWWPSSRWIAHVLELQNENFTYAGVPHQWGWGGQLPAESWGVWGGKLYLRFKTSDWSQSDQSEILNPKLHLRFKTSHWSKSDQSEVLNLQLHSRFKTSDWFKSDQSQFSRRRKEGHLVQQTIAIAGLIAAHFC